MNTIRTLNQLNRSDLLLAGGKGANLGALIEANLPVPPGFCITTPGYRHFVAANQLESPIQQALAGLQPDDPLALESAAETIRRLFEGGQMPEALAEEIRAAYRALADETDGPTPVAVRSSATAEDLPDLSFAGQQDTYLNILGAEALLRAVVRCWASLWTARAIGYRARNHIDQQEVALAVVVQQMVPSEVSGVLFTANPLTGKRGEVVIDATFGLGEALVSGMVEPDHYVVDSGGQILQKTLGSKAQAIRGLAGGGKKVVAAAAVAAEAAAEAAAKSTKQALPDAQIIALAACGRAAERFFGAPQDMEWAWAENRLYVLQSRAITSLYPLPQRAPTAPLEVLFSFASWQGMLQPLSPLGQDSFTGLAAGLGRIFGSQANLQEQSAMLAAGERLFANITGLARNPTGRGIARTFIGAIDPVSANILETLFEDPRLALKEDRMTLSARLRLLRAVSPLIAGVLYNLIWPASGRARLERKIVELVERTRARCQSARSLGELVNAVEAVPLESPRYLLPYLLPGIISGQAPLQVLLRLAETIENGPRLVMELTRGLPHNVTTEMDLKLWAVSRAIAADAPSAALFTARSAEELTAQYQAGQLPAAAQQAVTGFLSVYGMRGVAEIDIFRPRWSEDPQHIFQVLKSYLELGESSASPAAVFQNGAEKADQARAEIIAGFRRKRFGALKALLARFLTSRVRELGGLRETPKFTIVRMLAEVRAPLLRAGQQLVEQGVLAEAEDIFFLHLWELRALAENRLPEARSLVEAHKQAYAREMQRKRVPRLLLSDGSTYYDSAAGSGAASGGAASTQEEAEGMLTGSPVSAGVVEGTVRVVLDPHGTRLLPGEILVCPATDPAWTPLFLAAGGLVMEVGGMMTHGSVVAREYGIPAVVGVNQATTRLKTGQSVRVDGARGRIEILD